MPYLTPAQKQAESAKVRTIAADLYEAIADQHLMVTTTPSGLADSIAAIQAAAAKAYAEVTAIVAARS